MGISLQVLQRPNTTDIVILSHEEIATTGITVNHEDKLQQPHEWL